MPKIVAEQTDNDLFQVLDSANPRGFEDAQGQPGFFLAPQVSETFESVEDLKIDGDWLLGAGMGIDESHVPRPSIRYNRRTHELILDRHDYDLPDR